MRGETAKVPSVFGIGGRAARLLPPPPEAMPQTWRGTYEGNREYVTQLRRTAERRRALEDRHPELAGDRRPVLAHEGRFESAPLRAGDRIPAPPGPRGAHSQPDLPATYEQTSPASDVVMASHVTTVFEVAALLKKTGIAD